jgi:hypothetical protein
LREACLGCSLKLIFYAFFVGGIMAEIVVRLLAGDDEERSFFLSREFSSDVARLSGVVSRTPPAAAPEPGKRGDLGMAATVIAAVSGSGALTALVNMIGS